VTRCRRWLDPQYWLSVLGRQAPSASTHSGRAGSRARRSPFRRAPVHRPAPYARSSSRRATANPTGPTVRRCRHHAAPASRTAAASTHRRGRRDHHGGDRAAVPPGQQGRARAVEGAPPEPLPRPGRVLVRDRGPGFVADPPTRRGQPPDQVDVLGHPHRLVEARAQRRPAGQQRGARHVGHRQQRPHRRRPLPHVQRADRRLVAAHPAVPAAGQRDDPRCHQRQPRIGEVRQQGWPAIRASGHSRSRGRPRAASSPSAGRRCALRRGECGRAVLDRDDHGDAVGPRGGGQVGMGDAGVQQPGCQRGRRRVPDDETVGPQEFLRAGAEPEQPQGRPAEQRGATVAAANPSGSRSSGTAGGVGASRITARPAPRRWSRSRPAARTAP
jgi:hypothetical protein